VYRHILIPTDGSTLAQIGVQHGLSLASEGARATVVTVTEPYVGQFAYAADLWAPTEAELAAYEETQRDVAERILAPVRSLAKQMKVTVETIHIPGRLVSNAILETAVRLGCDAIVMSSHGRTGLSRALLGSQTAAVVSEAKVPVIVVR